MTLLSSFAFATEYLFARILTIKLLMEASMPTTIYEDDFYN